MKKSYFYALMLSLCFLSGTSAMYGQSIKGALQSTVNHLKPLDFEGTWRYEGVDVKFESDNLLKKAGGKAAAMRMEKDLNEQLEKMGFEPGVTTFTFNEDGTFTNVTNGKKIKGKYTYNSDKKEITLKYVNLIPVKAKVSGSGNKISFLFEARGFLSMVTFIGSHSGVSVLKGVSSILKSYDGMLVGMELKKE